MGLPIEEVVRRMTEKAQPDKHVGVVVWSGEADSIVYYHEETDLSGKLRNIEARGDKLIGLISYVPLSVETQKSNCLVNTLIIQRQNLGFTIVPQPSSKARRKLGL